MDYNSTRKSNTKDEQGDFSSASGSADIPPGMTIHDAQTLKSTLDDQILSFKENVMQNQFFQPTNPATQNRSLSWEENGRALGSLFAHDSYNNLQHQLPHDPRLSQEIQGVDPNYTFFVPGGDQSAAIGHSEIDRKFSTDYSYLYSNPSQEVDFNTLSHQVRGERALSLGYYNQAIQDLGKAIETNPTNPIPYLNRGIAHFSLGQYDRSLEDYEQFTSQSQAQKPNTLLSVSEFSLGFAKGLPNGVYESGEGLFLFLTDFVKHPIHTSTQIVDSITTLVSLVRNDEWGVVAEALSPEVYQLVTQWDTLPSEKKGELAGYAVGKHGTDILAPGALAKVASKSVKSAQELAAVCKNFQIAQETLVLETVAGIGNSTKIAEVIEAGQTIARLADELGVTTAEVGQLKQAGKLEEVFSNNLENILKNPAMRESYKRFEKAEAFLAPSGKKFMPEIQVRDLIHKAGMPTFPRPNGIPENFRVRLSDGGAGMLYVHPDHTHTSIRVMPGKPHSPNPSQQKPYVMHMKNGKAFDKHGNMVSMKAPEAHIPIEEFIYRA